MNGSGDVAAVILAAGLSSRMGRFKPLLPLGETTVLERCIVLFRDRGVDPVLVVTGMHSEQVADAALRSGATPVHNNDFLDGMFSSVLAGLRALPDGLDAFFLLPVDIPLVRPETVVRLRREFERLCRTSAQEPALIYPRFLGERGHPPLISARLLPEILAHNGTGGLRTVLTRHEAKAHDLDVADFGTAHDLDLPEDYQLDLKRVDKDYPGPEECIQLWEMQALSPEIRAHSRAVARVAAALEWGLRKAGVQLDADLIQSAALVHDVCKGQPRHDRAGAQLLAEHGFPLAASITATHSDLEIPPKAPITEREVVFLADKLVRGEAFTPLEQRYLEKLERFGDDPDARRNIQARLQRAQAVLLRLDEAAGASMEDLARTELQ